MKAANIQLTVFLDVFTGAVWCTILLFAVFTAGFYVLHYGCWIKEPPSIVGLAKTFAAGLYSFLLALLQKGEEDQYVGTSLALKTFLLTLNLLCFLLLTCYEGDLVRHFLCTYTFSKYVVYKASFLYFF